MRLKQLAACALIPLFFLLTACGGGGGGGSPAGNGGGNASGGGGGSGNSGTPASQSTDILFIPSSISATANVGVSKTIDVSVVPNVNSTTLSGVTKLYATVLDPAGVLNSQAAVGSQLNNTLYIAVLGVSPNLAPGRYQGNFQLRLCSDSACQSPIAGSPWTFPYDINVTAAYYSAPSGVVFDGAGNLYVADSGDAIGKITSSHVASILGKTQPDPVGGIVVDAAGNVFFSVSNGGTSGEYNTVIQELSPTGSLSTLPLTYLDHPSGASPTLLWRSQGLALDPQGNLIVADTVNDVIRKITPGGQVTTVAGQFPNSSGAPTGVSFVLPSGVAVDKAGNIYVTDTDDYSIRKIDTAGAVSTIAGGSPGSADGQGSAAQFNHPTGIAVDQAGNLYVSDTGNHTIRKITANGTVSTLAGKAAPPTNSPDFGYVNGQGAAARFNTPQGLTVDASGNVYVADTLNNVIRVITPDGTVSTLIATTH